MVEVVVGALVRDRRVLLAHRRPDKVAYPDVWELPGGVREEGESELEALVRELREEVGVEVDVASTTHLCRVEARPVAEPVVLSAWLVRDWQGTPANLAPEEHLDLGWFGLDELPPPANVDVRAALVRALTS
ncbi:NUDIX domain-containing protein [Nocardioides baculatus]|uniref:NUDIX domain-containing protein n=1 Tax=Nocardioides baculatus TaxID=2801337 RepID=A0ABS1LAF7_9ACTN|nr:NUDIX domain-containing protein [Nocardioides baculatus]MBL0748661.1 NUDIX domain-containing protein [Nocardioides baculatus]